ncbi:phage tail protein [Shewanella sp.]|uniref:phage tail protein n=1 Tax=Shewanella sp. TaxID=50422 RepID=UPI0025E639DC|nr:phage tail protein [Shewanella sp.]
MDILNDLFAPSVSHRFMTLFMFNGIPSPLDLSFQKISGLSRTLNTTSMSQGGENSRNYHFADKITHGSLLLERGVMTLTPLTAQFDKVLRGESVLYADVVILLLNHNRIPVSSWIISNALPVSWKTGDLDAHANSILINSLELRYQDMRWLGVKA